MSGGENVYTTEVENALASHPAVLELAVFGVPHEQWGEAVHAEVVLKPGTSVDRARADRPLPADDRRVQGAAVDRRSATQPLPKSGAGKILKRDIRAPYWDGHDRAICVVSRRCRPAD